MLAIHTDGRIAMFHLFPRSGQFSHPAGMDGRMLTAHSALFTSTSTPFSPHPSHRLLQRPSPQKQFSDGHRKQQQQQQQQQQNFLQNESNSHKLARLVLK